MKINTHTHMHSMRFFLLFNEMYKEDYLSDSHWKETHYQLFYFRVRRFKSIVVYDAIISAVSSAWNTIFRSSSF